MGISPRNIGDRRRWCWACSNFACRIHEHINTFGDIATIIGIITTLIQAHYKDDCPIKKSHINTIGDIASKLILG